MGNLDVRRLLRGVAGSGGIKAIFGLLTFATSVYLARVLGLEQYGIYVYAISIITLLSFPAQLGLPVLVVRQVARYDTLNEWKLLCGLLRRANQAVFVFSGIAAVILLLISDLLSSKAGESNGAQSHVLMIGAVLIPLTALGNLRGATLRGFGHVVSGQLPELFVRPLLFLAFVIYASTSMEFDARYAVGLQVASASVAFLAGVFLLNRVLPDIVRLASPTYDTKVWARSVLPLAILGGIQVIHHEIDVIVLGIFCSNQDVGLFFAALQGSYLVAFSLGMVNVAIAPAIARLHASGGYLALQNIVTWGARLVLAVAVPVCVLLILLGQELLELVYGVEFRDAYLALIILCVGQMVNAAIGSVALILNMTGYEKDAALGAGAGVLLNVILSFTLVPTQGIIGAALANAISMMAWNTILGIQVYRRLGISPLAFRFGR